MWEYALAIIWLFNLIKLSSDLIAIDNLTILAFNATTLASVVNFQLVYSFLSYFLSWSIYSLIYFNNFKILSTESPYAPLLNST